MAYSRSQDTCGLVVNTVVVTVLEPNTSLSYTPSTPTAAQTHGRIGPCHQQAHLELHTVYRLTERFDRFLSFERFLSRLCFFSFLSRFSSLDFLLRCSLLCLEVRLGESSSGHLRLFEAFGEPRDGGPGRSPSRGWAAMAERPSAGMRSCAAGRPPNTLLQPPPRASRMQHCETRYNTTQAPKQTCTQKEVTLRDLQACQTVSFQQCSGDTGLP